MHCEQLGQICWLIWVNPFSPPHTESSSTVSPLPSPALFLQDNLLFSEETFRHPKVLYSIFFMFSEGIYQLRRFPIKSFQQFLRFAIKGYLKKGMSKQNVYLYHFSYLFPLKGAWFLISEGI